VKSYVGKGNQPTESHFELRNCEHPVLREGEIRLQTLYVSVDPYMRGRLNEGKSYIAPFELNKPMNGSGVGRVVETRNSQYSVGEILTSQKTLSWPFELYVVFDDKTANEYTKLDLKVVPKHLISATIGYLGMPGLTAYFGLLERGKPEAGQTLIISGAAGACGSVAGQIGKIKGLRVIGIVGNQEKLDYITKELGFDGGIIYKDKSRNQIIQEIKTLCPKGIDIYYDNVGGEISNACISCLNPKARVPICGQISQYNEKEMAGLPSDLEQFVKDNSIERGWFMVFNFKDKFDIAWKEMFSWVLEGKLKCRETVVVGIQNIGKAFLGLFVGDNVGKAIVKIAQH